MHKGLKLDGSSIGFEGLLCRSTNLAVFHLSGNVHYFRQTLYVSSRTCGFQRETSFRTSLGIPSGPVVFLAGSLLQATDSSAGENV